MTRFWALDDHHTCVEDDNGELIEMRDNDPEDLISRQEELKKEGSSISLSNDENFLENFE